MASLKELLSSIITKLNSKVVTVNGVSPDENGNVQVSGLPEGAGAYQQLATDANGTAAWEEKPFYCGDQLLSVQLNQGVCFYKVSDNVPTAEQLASYTSVYLWVNTEDGSITMDIQAVTENVVLASDFCIFVLDDNQTLNGITFQERGVYFIYVAEDPPMFCSGYSLDNPDTPDVAWDGNPEEFKALDAKYLPIIPAEKLPTIPAEKLPTIPVEKLPYESEKKRLVLVSKNLSSHTLVQTTPPSFLFSNVTYEDILAAAKENRLVFASDNPDEPAVFNPECISISSNGTIYFRFVVLVNSALHYITLACNANNTIFYRNNWHSVECTKH